MLKPLLSCMLVVIPVSICFSQESPNPGETFFKTLDKNEDGWLTREELGAEKEALFNRLLTLSDKDEDGKLTREEFLNGVSPKPAGNADVPRPEGRPGERGQFPDPKEMFKRLDQNQDGQLTSEEMPGPFRERFAPVFEKLGKESLNVEEFGTAMTIIMERSSARPQMPDEEQFFGRLDQNQDGKVTLEEVPAPVRDRVKPIFDRLGKTSITREDFAKLRGGRESAGRDGSPAEMRRGSDRPEMQPSLGAPAPRGPRFFMMLDRDQDGQLSVEELSQASQLVSKLDRNDNGKLDIAELMGFGGRGPGGEQGRPGSRGPGDTNRPDRPRRPEMAEGEKPMRQGERPDRLNLRDASNEEFAKRFLERFDQNQDGTISKEEAPERMQGNFSRLDADDDGKVTAEELMAAMQRRNRD